jgi:hypothetical protein
VSEHAAVDDVFNAAGTRPARARARGVTSTGLESTIDPTRSQTMAFLRPSANVPPDIEALRPPSSNVERVSFRANRRVRGTRERMRTDPVDHASNGTGLCLPVWWPTDFNHEP